MRLNAQTGADGGTTINGNRNQANNFTLEGADMNELQNNQYRRIPPTPEAPLRCASSLANGQRRIWQR